MSTPNVTADGQHVGKVVQIIGPVLDVEFEGKYLPPIYQALRVVSDGFDVQAPIDVIAEVQQHLGEGRVRTVSMLPTDGMVRGMKVIDTGGPITMPVGEGTLGRVLNVIGDPVDTLGDVKHTERYPIHRHAPTFEEQSTELQMFRMVVQHLRAAARSVSAVRRWQTVIVINSSTPKGADSPSLQALVRCARVTTSP